MACQSPLRETLRIARLYKNVNSFVWRIRRQILALAQRPAKIERSHAANVAPTPAGTVRVCSVPTEVTSIVVSQGTGLVAPRDLPCHLENKFGETFLEHSAVLPVPKCREPKGDEFSLFSFFPAELRVQVWQNVASFERVAEIQYINRTQGFRHSASPRPPAILHVCSESRYEALKLYKLCFGTRKLPKSIYLNLATDILFFRVAEQSHTWRLILGPASLWREQLKLVRRIAFTYIGSSSLRFMKKTVCSFPNLEELIILWAEDAHAKSFTGRGANCIELVPSHINNQRYSSWQSAMRWKACIEEDFWWRRFRRPPLVISVRHWCARDMREW